MKSKGLFIFAVLTVTVIAFVGSCSHLQTPVSAEGTKNVIQMTASDFKFEPNNISARTGDALTFRIQNTTGTAHNFTLKNPDGTVMQSVDIPPRQSVEVKAAFPRPGTYRFYCDKTGHSELGMKGQVVAAGG